MSSRDFHELREWGRSANYAVVADVPGELAGSLRGYIVLRDLGPWDRYATITNVAERVVAEIWPALAVGAYERRLLYIDSNGHLDELEVRAGKFFRFRPGPCKDLETLSSTWPRGFPAFTVPK